MFDLESDAALGVLPGTTGEADPSSAFPIAGQTGLAIGSGTGQHGLTPFGVSGGGKMSDAITHLWQWLNRPFTSDMSPVDVMLLIGVVIVSILIWNLFLYHLRIAAEAI
jgi:hypothetical protein